LKLIEIPSLEIDVSGTDRPTGGRTDEKHNAFAAITNVSHKALDTHLVSSAANRNDRVTVRRDEHTRFDNEQHSVSTVTWATLTANNFLIYHYSDCPPQSMHLILV